MSLKLLENRNIDIDERDVSAVVAAVQSGALSGTSPLVRVYETELAEYFGSAFALAVSSGTAALQVLLYAYGIGPGDEVILPPTAPVMTVLPIIASRRARCSWTSLRRRSAWTCGASSSRVPPALG